MVRVVIIGGKLQGTEAAYLARRAGFEAVLVDRRENTPAQGLCPRFVQADVCAPDAGLIDLLETADFVLPATENRAALDALEALAGRHSITMAFDFAAQRLTASKAASDALFHQNGIPAPAYYPACAGPYIAKPVGGSGSKGVCRLADAEAVERFLAGCEDPANWIVQEYLEGRAYSMEVIGRPGRYRTYQATEIHVDVGHDCNRVTCPCPELDAALLARFSAVAVRLAELVGLHGIMDVEAIHSRGALKVLEIDARLPSQTPAAVYHSTGVNFLAELHRLFCGGDAWQGGGAAAIPGEKPTAYEHLEVRFGPAGAGIREIGEGGMAGCGPLSLHENRWGAQVVLTDWQAGAGTDTLRATLISSAPTAGALEGRRRQIREALAAKNGRRI